jgi:hypothetical protein
VERTAMPSEPQLSPFAMGKRACARERTNTSCSFDLGVWAKKSKAGVRRIR